MKLYKSWRTALIFLVIVAVISAIYFRFANIDRKVYSQDEVFTSLRISGYTEQEMVQDFANLRIVDVAYIQKKYQQVNPERSAIGTITGLAKEEPQLTPIYHLTARFWAEHFGSSVASIRTVSALLSLLAFPCMYWLCIELFESQLTAGIAVILLAISPFFLIFGQGARHYGLWSATVLFSNVALLRAIRLKTKTSWGIYTFALIIDIYTCLISILVAVGQGFYVLVLERFRLRKTLLAYLAASFLAALAFLPWVLEIIQNWSQVRQRTAMDIALHKTTSVLELIKNQSRELIHQPVHIFFDIDLSSGDPILNHLAHYFFTGASLILVLYAIYILCRTTQKSIWLFVLALILANLLGLLLQDLTLGAYQRASSTTSRYLIPCYLGLIIVVAHLFSYKLTSFSHSWRPKLWQSVFFILVSAGLASCIVNSQAKVWWDKGSPEELRASVLATDIINKSTKPLLVTNLDNNFMLLHTHLLNSKVPMLVIPYQPFSQTASSTKFELNNIRKFSQKFNHLFLLLGYSSDLNSEMKRQKARKLPCDAAVLWRLEALSKVNS